MSKKALGHLQKQTEKGCSCVQRQKTLTNSIEPVFSEPLTIKSGTPETTALLTEHAAHGATPFRFCKSDHPQISIRDFNGDPSVNGIIEA